MALKFKKELPFEYWRWKLIEKTGWTLEYVDALKMSDFHEFLQVLDGETKAFRPPQRR